MNIKVGAEVKVTRTQVYKNNEGDNYDLYSVTGIVKGYAYGAYVVKIPGYKNSSTASGYFFLKEEDVKLKVVVKPEVKRRDKVKHVSFNKKKGVTHMVFEDGTKVKVTRQKGDKWDKRQGVLNCLAKRYLDVNSRYNDIIKELVEKGVEYVD